MHRLIYCPRCNKKITEQEVREDEYMRLYCESCKRPFWICGELTVKRLVDFEEIKNESKLKEL